jgi:hypothetical protein
LGCGGVAARPTGPLVTASIGTFGPTLRSDPASILIVARGLALALACYLPPPLAPYPPLPLLAPCPSPPLLVRLPAEHRPCKPHALCPPSLALHLPPSCLASASFALPAIAVEVPATAPALPPALPVTRRATGLLALPLLRCLLLSPPATSPLFPCKIPPPLPLQSVLASGGRSPFSSGRPGELLLGRSSPNILPLFRPSALILFPFF